MALLGGTLLADPAAARRPAASAPHATAPPDVQGMLSRGVLALASRDFAVAYREFSDAYRAAPSPELLYQLGIVASAEGKRVEAHDLLRRFLAEAAKERSASKVAEAERVLAEGTPPSGELRVSGDAGADVELDGRLVGRLPLSRPLLVAAGTHRLLVVYKGGRAEASLDVRADTVQAARAEDGKPGLAVTSIARLLPLVTGPATLPWADVVARAVGREELVTVDAAALGAAAPPAGCWESRSCLLALAGQPTLDWLLHVAAAPTPAGAKIAVELVDVPGGTPVGSAERPCEPCTVEAAEQTVAELLHQLLSDATKRPRGHLQIATAAADAEVELAGWKQGPAPLDRPTRTGTYEVRVTAPGRLPASQTITVAPETPTKLELRLAPVPVAETSRPTELHWVRQPRPYWRLAVGGGAAAAGVALIGVGGWALSVNGTCIDPPSPPIKACPSLYDTTGLGAGLVAAGVLVAGGGALLLALPGPRRLVPVEKRP